APSGAGGRGAGRGVQPASATAVARTAMAARRMSGRSLAGPLQVVDLAAQALGLVGLGGAAEGVAVDAQRVALAAGLQVGVAEMLGDGRVVAGDGDRALEVLDGADVVAALVEHPAEAVDVEAVVRTDLQRAADQRLGFVEVDALLGVRV